MRWQFNSTTRLIQILINFQVIVKDDLIVRK